MAQNGALRTMLGAPRWCSACVMQSEAGLVPLADRVSFIATCRVARVLRRDAEGVVQARIRLAMAQGEDCLRGSPWLASVTRPARVLGRVASYPGHWREADVPAATYRTPAPWEPPPATFTATALPARKAALTTQELRQRALGAIEDTVTPGGVVYYTDGSVDPDSGRSGAAAVTEGVQLSCRTSDHCSSLQTELVAISLALEHAQRRPEDTVVIITDSRAALQVLRQPHHTDNVGLATAVLASLQGLAERRRQVRLHWVPSHVGIRGNEAADEAAKGAAAGPAVTRHVLPSLRQVRTLARRATAQHAHQTHRGLEGAKRQAAWYAAATDYQPLHAAEQQPRADGVLLQRP